MEAPRLHVSARFRELMAYDKFAGPAPRILVLESHYWLDAACINAGRALGWTIETAPVLMEGVLPRDNVEQLLWTLGAFRPDFVLSVNLAGMDVQGLFARLFEDLRLPLVAWFVDDPRTIVMGRSVYASPYAVALTWEQAYTSYLKSLRFPLVCHVPLAADPSVFNHEPEPSPDLPPAFVGNSMSTQASREWSHVNADEALAASVRRAFDAGRVTRENFGRGLEALLEPGLAARLDEEQQRHAELVFFMEGTQRVRHGLVRLLEPEGLEVYGDGGWREVTPRSKNPLDYTEALPEFYRRCAVNLNSTSIQMPKAVNQRVFDCPAAGGFLLTDAQEDLADLFDVEQEVACYRNEEECLSLFRHYLAHPPARREIARRARARVLGEHTYAHRLQRIVDIVKERFAP